MPLPVGTWKANVNGTVIDLKISGVDPQGLFPVNLLNDTQGFWNEIDHSCRSGLSSISGGAVGQGVVAIFEGCLFRSPTNPQAGQDVTATLAGTVRVAAGATAIGAFPATPSSRRSVFGWYAQITEVV